MLFKKLYINYFGKLHDLELELKPGINLVYGENEAGKSTIHAFIKGMLFGIDRLRGRASNSKEDLYARYLPWENPGAYCGRLDLNVGDKEYQIQRNFHAMEKSFKVFDKKTGREVLLEEGHISEIIPGLTETTYKNTISIEQRKAKTEVELSYEVRNYLANLSETKSNDINVTKAIQYLKERKKDYEIKELEERVLRLKQDIKEGYEIEDRMDALAIELQNLLEEEKQLVQQKEELEINAESKEVRLMEQFPAILENYCSYCELKKQYTINESQKENLSQKIILGEQGLCSSQVFQEEGKKAELLIEEIKGLEELQRELHIVKVDKESNKDANRNKASNKDKNRDGNKNYNKGKNRDRNEDYNKDYNNGTNKDKYRDGYKDRTKDRIIYGFLSLSLFGIITYILYRLQYIGLEVVFSLNLLGFTLLTIRSVINYKSAIELKNKRNTLHNEIQNRKATLSVILQKHRVNSVQELVEKIEMVRKNTYSLEYYKDQKKELLQRLDCMEEALDQYYDKIMGYMQKFFWEDELNEGSMNKLQEEINKKKRAIITNKEEISKKQEACILKIEKIKWEMEALQENEEVLLKNINLCQELEQKRKNNEIELQAIQYALHTIQTLSIDIHDEFGKQLNDAASSIIREITDNKYTELKIDEKMEIKVGWRGSYLPLERLSAGTIDQVYFALRISVGDLLMKQPDGIPIILDDCFAFYDENRVKAVLSTIDKKEQTILFTCHKREKELLEGLGIPYHLVELT